MPVTMEDLRAGRIDLAEVVDPDGAGSAGHPGEHVRDWLDETGTTAYALAKAMGVPGNRLLAILAGRRAITADTALRLGAATATNAERWLGLQGGYNLEVAPGKGVGADVRQWWLEGDRCGACAQRAQRNRHPQRYPAHRHPVAANGERGMKQRQDSRCYRESPGTEPSAHWSTGGYSDLQPLLDARITTA